MKTHSVNFLASPEQLVKLNSALQNSQTKISTFFGDREVTVGDHSIALTSLTRQILDLGYQFLDGDITLSTEERIAAIEITQKLKDLYKQTDDQIAKSWFSPVRKAQDAMFGTFPGIRDAVDTGRITDIFKLYSDQSFKDTFGALTLRERAPLVERRFYLIAPEEMCTLGKRWSGEHFAHLNNLFTRNEFVQDYGFLRNDVWHKKRKQPFTIVLDHQRFFCVKEEKIRALAAQ